MTTTNLGALHQDASALRSRAVSVVAVSTLLAYFLVVLVLRQFHFGGGWAAVDARQFHIPVINYFLGTAFDLNYPTDSISMFPGMHMFFAIVGRLLGFGNYEFEGLRAFLIQSIFGGLLLFGVYRLTVSVCSTPIQAFCFLVISLSSSYTLFSWIYLTTELGSLAFFVLMLLIMMNQQASVRQSFLFSGLSIASMLFRQSNATLSVGLMASKAAANFRLGRPLLSGFSFADLIAPFAAVCFLSLLLHVWGGLVPPESRSFQPSSINLVALAHLFALTGLIAWPFVVPAGRILSADRRLLLAAVAFAAGVALISCIALPLDFDRESGRWGSIVWTVEALLHRHGLGTASVGVAIAVGVFVWTGILGQCVRARTVLPEVLLFGLLAVSMVGQQMSWQRYFEAQLLVTLAVGFMRSDPRRSETVLCGVWFGCYYLVSIAKLIY